MQSVRPVRPSPAEPQPLPPSADSPDAFLDVLNRDQRTTITIDRTSRSEPESPRGAPFRRPDPGHASRPPSDTANPSGDAFRKRTGTRGRGPKRRPDTLLSRLGEVFIVGVCLLTIVRVPGVMSAPSTRHAKANEQIHSHKPTEDTYSYLHPCGQGYGKEVNRTYNSLATAGESDPEMIKKIIIQAKNALAFAERFREPYVEQTFRIRFDIHHSQWAGQGYDWLPNHRNVIPKELGQNIPDAHLTSRTLNEFLIDMYEYLQKLAVGLEQVVVDQKQMQGKFSEKFRTLEVLLRTVLCEVREAMLEKNLPPRSEVEWTIMSENIRHLEQASFRNLRDWFIFRDLMNVLEYVIQVLTYYEEKVEASS